MVADLSDFEQGDFSDREKLALRFAERMALDHHRIGACPMKLGREVSRHNELDNWRNTHRFESVMATTWLLLTISETEPGLWDRLIDDVFFQQLRHEFSDPEIFELGMITGQFIGYGRLISMLDLENPDEPSPPPATLH